MKAEGKITKAEGLLLGLAALFLCGLLVLARQDRLAARSAPWRSYWKSRELERQS